MCGRVWCGFDVVSVCYVWKCLVWVLGVSVCCVWDSMEWFCGSEFVLCVGEFGVDLWE